jgi:hypothetical protein
MTDGEVWLQADGLTVMPTADGGLWICRQPRDVADSPKVDEGPYERVGYIWQHAETGEVIPDDRFPEVPDQSADPSDYVTFDEAIAGTNMTSFEISKACSRGKVRFLGERQGRLVHGADLIRERAAKRRRREEHDR